MDAGRRMREIPGRIDRAGGTARSQSFHYCSFSISIPLCCAVASRRHRWPLNSRSRMRRPVLNNYFEIADFLLGPGADINTNWRSHEPASILHELVFHRNYEAMQFLIDRGIDMTIVDYRWRSTAQGWASYAVKDEKMAQWLREAQQRREQASR